jgi:hypothetical protein
MHRDTKSTGLGRVFEQVVAALDTIQVPAIRLDHLDQVSGLHSQPPFRNPLKLNDEP